MVSDVDDRPVIIGWLCDPSRVARTYTPDAIYERLLEEVFGEPDVTRSHVITLHLYVEYWLIQLLTKLGRSVSQSFSKKVQALVEAGVLEDGLAKNLALINRIRNVYAHELDLPTAATRVHVLMKQFRFDPYFMTTDPDPLRAICLQVMFLLEATYNNDCNPPKIQFPNAESRARLQRDGRLHWQSCEILSKEINGNDEEYKLRCPLCETGTIIRQRDATPGFKDALMSRCQTCGLTGDGYYVDVSTPTGKK